MHGVKISMTKPINRSILPFKNKFPRKYPSSGVHKKFMIREVLVNLMFEKLFRISFNGMSRNSVNSINAKKIVISDGLICLRIVILLHNKPSNTDPNINTGSNFSTKSILCISFLYF